MAIGVRFYPKRVNIDLQEGLCDPDVARFIKNLVWEVTDTSEATHSRGAQTGVMKPIESTYLIGNVPLPPGTNMVVGSATSKAAGCALALVWNKNNNHTLYRINAADESIDIIDQGPWLELGNRPTSFIGEGQGEIQIIYLTDPATGATIPRTFFYYTTGQNTQKQIVLEDSFATQGYNATKFPYFNSKYDPSWMRRMGLSTPNTCLTFTENPITTADAGQNNTIIFNTWQFRITYIDVWGRPSEHGVISDLYIPGINDCLSGSTGIPRCLTLSFDAGSPIVNAIQVEYRNGNNDQWYLDTTLFLYNGSNIGPWWLRQRNSDITYDSNTNLISYVFCRNKECDPIPVTETERTENDLPITSQAINKIGQFLGLGNNTEGFLPLSQDILNKIHINITSPPEGKTQLRQARILVPIYNNALGNYQQVSKDGTNGYIWGDNNGDHGGARNYSQFFTNKNQSGFGGYLAGTGNYVIGQQFYVAGDGSLVADPDFEGLSASPYHIVFQEFLFTNLQPGTYIFRLFSHLADPTQTTNWATTSTTVWGLCPFVGAPLLTNPKSRINTTDRYKSQELEINVCNGNYDTLSDNKILVIADLAYQIDGTLSVLNRQSRTTCGYIYETQVNGFNQYPIELMSIKIGAANSFTSVITDHNGFYWFSFSSDFDTKPSWIGFELEYKCKQVDLFSGFNFPSNMGFAKTMNFCDVIVDQYNSGGVFPFADFADPNNGLCNRIIVTGTILLAPNNIPIPNFTVVLSRGSYATTDDNGVFQIVAHDDMTNPPGVGPRNDFIIAANSGCNYTSTNGGCITPIPILIVDCTPGQCVKRTVIITFPPLFFQALRGLLSGGVYGIAMTPRDWLGRERYSQLLGYITMPNVIQTQTLAPSTVTITMDRDIIFPSDVAYLNFSMTAETTLSDYLTWIVDRVQFVDNTGNVNNVAPSQIKIYYASIIEYNKQNNFNTTDSWAFIPANQNTPATGDKVQFFINGDGTFFTKSIISLIKYDQTGQYFLIDYDSALANLQANALIRLMRPKQCALEEEPYYEACPTVLINNGVPSAFTITPDFFDTYYVSRGIPVPTPLTTSTAGQAVTTSTTSVSAGITTTESYTVQNPATTNELRTFGFLFEHHSPSNFWGYKNWNQGRVNVKNPYETVIHKQDWVALSGTLSINGQLNYLNYFTEANQMNYENANLYGITAMIHQMSVLFILGQYNNFRTGFSDNLIRVNPNGTVQAQSIDNALGQPETKVGMPYGCVLEDKSTVSEFDGIVCFLDRTKTSVIRYDYQTCKPISNNVCDSYLIPKIKSVIAANQAGGNRYFIGKINPNNSDYLLSDFDANLSTYLNQAREYTIDLPDTIAFDSKTGIFKGWFGYTPEFYASLEGDSQAQQLFSFTSGFANGHYSVNKTNYGSIYGTPVNRTYRVILSLGKDKKGKLLSLAVYCKQGVYFVDQLLTETGQLSRILKSYFNQAMYFWQAPTLCDLNTPYDPNLPQQTGPNKLTDGNNLVGTWFDLRFIGDPSIDNQYSELQAIDVFIFGSEKTGTQ